MNDERKPLWPWIVALLIGLSFVYVMSSGPSQTLACRYRFEYSILGGGFGQPTEQRILDRGRWWPKIFAPLVWAAEKKWGEPVNRYWGRFPVKQAGPFE
jgi:hypothetical protein